MDRWVGLCGVPVIITELELTVSSMNHQVTDQESDGG